MSRKVTTCAKAICIVFGLTLLVIVPSLVSVHALDAIFQPGEKPNGLMYGQWSVKWWQWALSIPSDRNPISDESGKYCNTSQNDPYAWFLAGSGGGKVVRDCSVPYGKAIFFPVLNVECSFAESPTAKTEADLRNCAHADQNTVSYLALTIDGTNFPNLKSFRVDSPLFSFSTPENGLFDLHSVTSQAVSDGFYVMVRPLSVGTHEIHIFGFLGDLTTIGPQNQPEDTLYRITVK
jgi:hypothetical protein